MEQTPIYLDAQGTERPRPEAIATITHFLTEGFGNPSATANGRGRTALARLERARSTIASHLGAEPDGVVFCSGASEANNFFLKSVVSPSGTFLTSAIEHKSVLQLGETFTQAGTRVLTGEVRPDGIVDIEDLYEKIDGGKCVVSVMHANNETGVVQPIKEIADICRERGATLHVDAAQTVGKLPVNLATMGAHALTVSGHKFGGPVGSGALVVCPEIMPYLRPLIVGGGQETGLRAGTTPIALIAGMADALDAATASMDQTNREIGRLRDMLVSGLRDLPGFFVNGTMKQRLTCNFNGGFEGVEAILLMRLLPHLQMAAGSACTTGHTSSHVLEAMNVSDSRRRASLRMSLSWATTEADIAATVDALRLVVPQLMARAGKQ